MGDAAYVILTRPSREFTGHFCIDDETLASVGVKDLSKYAMTPGAELIPDFFV
jgi:citronellol/citronellal dehydrogenase